MPREQVPRCGRHGTSSPAPTGTKRTRTRRTQLERSPSFHVRENSLCERSRPPAQCRAGQSLDDPGTPPSLVASGARSSNAPVRGHSIDRAWTSTWFMRLRAGFQSGGTRRSRTRTATILSRPEPACLVWIRRTTREKCFLDGHPGSNPGVGSSHRIETVDSKWFSSVSNDDSSLTSSQRAKRPLSLHSSNRGRHRPAVFVPKRAEVVADRLPVPGRTSAAIAAGT